jgi:hypothetical protein
MKNTLKGILLLCAFLPLGVFALNPLHMLLTLATGERFQASISDVTVTHFEPGGVHEFSLSYSKDFTVTLPTKRCSQALRATTSCQIHDGVTTNFSKQSLDAIQDGQVITVAQSRLNHDYMVPVYPLTTIANKIAPSFYVIGLALVALGVLFGWLYPSPAIVPSQPITRRQRLNRMLGSGGLLTVGAVFILVVVFSDFGQYVIGCVVFIAAKLYWGEINDRKRRRSGASKAKQPVSRLKYAYYTFNSGGMITYAVGIGATALYIGLLHAIGYYALILLIPVVAILYWHWYSYRHYAPKKPVKKG